MNKEFIVKDCKHCGGWCCKCLRSGGKSLPYWKVITPEEVTHLNPWIPSVIVVTNHQWVTCERLTPEGLCSNYSLRDEVCKTYPDIETSFMEYLFGDMVLYAPWCAYRDIVLEMLNIPFEVLATGEECRLKYLEKIQNDSTYARRFVGKFDGCEDEVI